ncbi:hypothetical protein LK994_08765 [Ferruginibacter lapsinanis]|uniref:hypothetical protein n=1 Tax=Ferruginibacter lapsinanis TaxID=563172 RepID=UPI001E3F95D9|nr:hypothetical protein [Ferruginibacter lapsinanis]UEG48727.1 hypothetical protein LK994_08765 [Ferruginibacter lapsinanis]
MTDISTNYDQPVAKRPNFLTVLCVLTFIGSGWGLISNTMQYFSVDKNAAAISMVKESTNAEMEKAAAGNDAGGKIAKDMMNGVLNVLTPENLKKMSIAGIATAILCLAGAILMWGLKKTGFYAYIAGTLVGIITPFVLFGGSSLMAVGMSAIMGFFGVVFVILYGVNLKHMH